MARLRFFDFFVRMCRLKAFWKVISPVPVTLKRFLALEFVLTFGIIIICLRLLPAGGAAQAAHLLGRVGIRAAKVGENALATNIKINPVYKNTFYEPGRGFSWHRLLRRSLVLKKV